MKLKDTVEPSGPLIQICECMYIFEPLWIKIAFFPKPEFSIYSAYL